MSYLKFDSHQQALFEHLKNITCQLQDKSFLRFFGIDVLQKCGVYLYGDVGTGKTMLMQAFYDKLKVKKVMFHYQNFIQLIHSEIHLLQNKSLSQGSILSNIAKRYSAQARVICLDEFEIKDITDAMIVGALLQAFISHKVFIFVTSNTKPVDLYKDGLQRASFLPVIDVINRQFHVLHLDNGHDYRLDLISHLGPTRILYPINEHNQLEMQKIISYISENNSFTRQDIEMFGRHLSFSKAHKSTLVTDFDELFMRELSYVDYVHICQKFTTIVVKNVRIIQSNNTDVAIRFINFIDNAYFYKIVLFMLLEDEPVKIYQTGARAAEYKRTVSRLHEMNSAAYFKEKRESE